MSISNRRSRITDLQEILSLLKHIKEFWYFVFDGDESAMERLDAGTVLAVENAAPGACKADAQRLYGSVISGEIFTNFNEQERVTLWTRLFLASTDCLVPSLFGFFENLKYLHAMADCMKRLVHPGSKETIQSVLESGFSSAEQGDACLVQVSSSSVKSVPANSADQFDLYYRQLWLNAAREYRDMLAEPKKKLAGPNGGRVNKIMLFNFALLAYTLGFCTPEIHDLLQGDPDREMARWILITARNPGQYVYEDLESHMTQVVDMISTAQLIKTNEDMNQFEIEERAKPPKFCGIPNYLDQPQDKVLMFLDKLHAPIGVQFPLVWGFCQVLAVLDICS